jgi:ubiquinone/menaquinone biosynthesis C-methylase UbiE
MEPSADYVGVTEVAGDPASAEQIQRMVRRYYWAADRVKGLDVLEVACGPGQGLGYLKRFAKHIVGGDVSAELVQNAKRHYGDRVEICQFNAESIPYDDRSFDVIIIFEAIYYIRNIQKFLTEARRVLRSSGKILIATANKDLFDFTPSPYSVDYYGVIELEAILRRNGFSATFYGDTPIESVSLRQRLFRPLKKIATATGLMPESKMMKGLLKRFVFGGITSLPAEVQPDMPAGSEPTRLRSGEKNTTHKVLLVEAELA